MVDDFKFSDDDEKAIEELRKSVKEKADYDLRHVISISQRLKETVKTNNKDEYGDYIEDWDKITTKELIKLYTEGSAWDFYSTPIRMNAFIESSLADIIYKYEYNSIISSDSVKGTVAVKNAIADMQTNQHNFAATYRKMYCTYVTEVLKSFGMHLHRLEKIINWRQMEERVNPNKNPF